MIVWKSDTRTAKRGTAERLCVPYPSGCRFLARLHARASAVAAPVPRVAGQNQRVAIVPHEEVPAARFQRGETEPAQSAGEVATLAGRPAKYARPSRDEASAAVEVDPAEERQRAFAAELDCQPVFRV
jgi:hypothetical protein